MAVLLPRRLYECCYFLFFLIKFSEDNQRLRIIHTFSTSEICPPFNLNPSLSFYTSIVSPFKPKSLPSNFPFQIIIKYTICLIHVLNRKTFDIQKRWLKIKLPSVLGLIIRILKLINFTFDNVHKGKWKMWLNEWDILLPAVKYGWDGTHTHCLLSTQTFR